MSLLAPTRVLVLGGGGREHALAWRLANEPGTNEIVVAPGSAGIASEPRVRVLPVDPLDPGAVVALARATSVELVVVGPEAPLAAGVVDALHEAGIPVFGPTQAAARIESSKAFCREVAEAAGVPMARGGAFHDLEPALRPRARARAGRSRRRGQGGRPRGRQGRRPSARRRTRPRRRSGHCSRTGPGGTSRTRPGGPARPRPPGGHRGAPLRPRGEPHRPVRRHGRPRPPVRARPQAAARRRCRAEHRRHGCVLAAARPAGRRGRRAHRALPPPGARGAGPARDPVHRRPVRRPDPHRGRPGPARVQRPLRRPGDPGAAAAPGRRARSAAPRRGAGPACRRRARPAAARQPGPGDARRGRRDRAGRQRLSGHAAPGRSDRAGSIAPAGRRSCSTPARTRTPSGGYRTTGGRVLAVVGRAATLDDARAARGCRRRRDHVRRVPAPSRHRAVLPAGLAVLAPPVVEPVA